MKISRLNLPLASQHIIINDHMLPYVTICDHMCVKGIKSAYFSNPYKISDFKN